LRAAIQEANDTAGADVINFNITTASKTITPGTPLPPITDAVTIDGYSQSGAGANTLSVGNNATLRIVLDGINLGAAGIGLEIQASDSVVRGLVIMRFGDEEEGGGILITGNDNDVRGNFIGTNAAGDTARPNHLGIKITGQDNVVGGTAPGMRNLISGNHLDGVLIRFPAATGNIVLGNYIGTRRGGGAALGNGRGVTVFEGTSNVIGGTSAGAGNVISGNEGDGIAIFGGEGDDLNTIQGNLIGLDAGGAQDVGNGMAGIYLAADSVVVGGTSASARNVISGNSGAGIYLYRGENHSIRGNYIGTNAAGTAAVANDTGVFGEETTLNVIGGTSAGARNVISGNQVGISLLASSNNAVLGNRIGTKADGTGDLGNVTSGIILHQSGGNSIGNSSAGAGNAIVGNGGHGLSFAGTQAGGLNTIVNNLIASNDGHGAYAETGPNEFVGNIFVQNLGDGVHVDYVGGTRIVGNQILANGGLGIDLAGGTEDANGVTANDDDDVDTGLQNFPVLTSATRSNNTGVTTVMGTLNSTPNATFRIDLYLAVADPSGHGEGQILVATKNITTNVNGDKGFSFASGQLVVGHVLTAVATRVPNAGIGITSEFSANLTVVSGT
jgi:titin